ncbi:MAG: outer membrane protein [Gammaproteobacteria bacterium]
MKKLYFLILPCLMISTMAHAQWTGMYAGGNLGYAWNSSEMETKVSHNGTYFISSDADAIAAVGSGSSTSSNVLGGAQVGYHWQSDKLVIGFEFDVNAYDTSTTRESTGGYPCCSPSTFTIEQSVETNWLTTLRPHVGYTYGNLLAYVTGGLAVADIQSTSKFYDDFGTNAYEKSSASSTRAGWTAGAGVEYSLSTAWSIGAQYLYTSFGSISSSGELTDDVGEVAGLEHDADLTSNILRLNVNCHFG